MNGLDPADDPIRFQKKGFQIKGLRNIKFQGQARIWTGWTTTVKNARVFQGEQRSALLFFDVFCRVVVMYRLANFIWCC